VREGEPVQQMKNSQGGVAGTRKAGAGAKTWQTANNIGIQHAAEREPEKADDDGVVITTPTSALNAKHPVTPANEEVEVVPPETVGPGPAASPTLLSYFVGKGISLPFGQLLPSCAYCNCSALIAANDSNNPGKKKFLCLDHGLHPRSVTRDLFLRPGCSFISPEHEAAIRAFLA